MSARNKYAVSFIGAMFRLPPMYRVFSTWKPVERVYCRSSRCYFRHSAAFLVVAVAVVQFHRCKIQ
ncbi:hypothetical protein U1Q18_051311, partial [Sarracenia purpurea var. burkii]